MPRGNGTGPAGMGPMTGRAMGYCGGYGGPGFTVAAPGRVCGRGAFRGRAFWPGSWCRPAADYGRRPQVGARWPWRAWRISREDELEYLKEQASALKEELGVISDRISEMGSEAAAREGESK